MNKKLYEIAKKYVVCLIFSVALMLLVLFSEMIRSTFMNLTSISFVFFMSLFMLLVVVVIPVLLLLIWFVNPIITERLLATFGLTVKSLDDKSKSKREEKTKEKS